MRDCQLEGDNHSIDDVAVFSDAQDLGAALQPGIHPDMLVREHKDLPQARTLSSIRK